MDWGKSLLSKIKSKEDNLLDLLLEGSITKDIYDEKFKRLKEEEAEVKRIIENCIEFDETYYITVSKVLDVASRAYEIFKSSEIEEKRQLLNFLLQNCLLEGEKPNIYNTRTV